MSGFYRFGDPGQDSIAHLNTGRRGSGKQCASPKFEADGPQSKWCLRHSVALCDAPGCDAPMCELHRTRDRSKANTDYCPKHKDLAPKGLFDDAGQPA